jgi:ribosomal protein S1
MSRLRGHLADTRITADAIRAARRIAETLTVTDHPDKDSITYFTGIVSRICQGVTRLPEAEADFDELFRMWLNHPASFDPKQEIFPGNQEIGFGAAVRRLIKGRKISPNAEPVVRFYVWLARWNNFDFGLAHKAFGAVEDDTWAQLEQSLAANERVSGVIFGQVKGGFAVVLDGAVAFLPGSEVDIRPAQDIDPLLGVPQPFRIIKLDRSRANIIVSRRAVLEASRRSEIFASISAGSLPILDGVIKNTTDYGAFVDLGGVDGLVHKSEITHRRITHPSEVLRIGQAVKVQVIGFNRKKQQISLGMKQLEPDPWEGIERRYPAGAECRGHVGSITDYGAFVELEPGVNGLVHISQMGCARGEADPRKIVSLAQEVEVVVLGVDPQRRRISLGLKRITHDP